LAWNTGEGNSGVGIPRENSMSFFYKDGPLQFSLARLLQLFVFASVVASLFALFPWPVALLVVCGINAMVAIYSWFKGRAALCYITLTTSGLILATLFFADWGVSRPNGNISVAWPVLIAACVAQVGAVAVWLLSGSKNKKT
jgi:hypothetical protein